MSQQEQSVPAGSDSEVTIRSGTVSSFSDDVSSENPVEASQSQEQQDSLFRQFSRNC